MILKYLFNVSFNYRDKVKEDAINSLKNKSIKLFA